MTTMLFFGFLIFVAGDEAGVTYRHAKYNAH